MSYRKRRLISLAVVGGSLVGVFAVVLAMNTAIVQPFEALGGVVWLSHGPHYLDSSQVAERVTAINAPKEAKLADSIEKATPLCDAVGSGYCQQSPARYAIKSLVSPAVAYVPAVPDKKVIIGYCTLCDDGTFSPSCAVGRGACSWHGGVASYNVAQYRMIPGTPAVPAQPAVYSYSPKTYKDSPTYVSPVQPDLNTIASFAN